MTLDEVNNKFNRDAEIIKSGFDGLFATVDECAREEDIDKMAVIALFSTKMEELNNYVQSKE